MIEAALAIALTSMAGSAILLGINASLDATSHVVDETIAGGMAQQLVDEVIGAMYAAPGSGPYQTDLGPNNQETAGNGRERYDDIDDFDDISTAAPTDLYGITLGTEDGKGSTRPPAFQVAENYFSDWRQTVDVYYVNAADFSQRLSGNNTSDYRCVDVKIERNDPTRGWRTLAERRRIVTFLQTP